MFWLATETRICFGRNRKRKEITVPAKPNFGKNGRNSAESRNRICFGRTLKKYDSMWLSNSENFAYYFFFIFFPECHITYYICHFKITPKSEFRRCAQLVYDRNRFGFGFRPNFGHFGRISVLPKL